MSDDPAPPGRTPVGERVSWETCPQCGRTAAVGWTTTHNAAGTDRDMPVEFDCPAGCRLTAEELRRAFTDRP